MNAPAVRRVASLALLLSVEMLAQPNPSYADANSGARLAALHCAECHLVPSDVRINQRTNAGKPSFDEIAAIEGQSRERIISRIIMPDHPMPTVSLTPEEIGDLTEYILSLRSTD